MSRIKIMCERCGGSGLYTGKDSFGKPREDFPKEVGVVCACMGRGYVEANTFTKRKILKDIKTVRSMLANKNDAVTYEEFLKGKRPW